MITDLRLFHLKTGMGDEISQFNRPQHTKEYIFETPLRASLTQRMAFLMPPIQQNGIFKTPTYKHMAFLRPPTQIAFWRQHIYKKKTF